MTLEIKKDTSCCITSHSRNEHNTSCRITPLSSNGRNTSGRKLLSLDLDSTLIHTVTLTAKELDTKLGTFIIKGDDYEPSQDEFLPLYLVKERPYMRKFIQRANQLFDLGVFTAADGYYADVVITNLFDGIDLKVRNTLNQCKVERNPITKEITKIKKPIATIMADNKQYNEKNILVIDDDPSTFEDNHLNAILVAPWHGEENDTLFKTLIKVIELAATLDDVRKIGEVWKSTLSNDTQLLPTAVV